MIRMSSRQTFRERVGRQGADSYRRYGSTLYLYLLTPLAGVPFEPGRKEFSSLFIYVYALAVVSAQFLASPPGCSNALLCGYVCVCLC